LRDEHFGKRIEDHRIDAVSRLVIDFDISVTVSHSSNDTVKVESHRTSFWCPVDNVLEAVDLICAFEWGLHVLTKGE
jgi:hypothetical protein